ncbi:UNKNOWN [Stylonychia lemnae]|uniref:Acyltransferase 3 domain-containing protein n=1 Tax=Stylonychia lemnae TaxID=5949 RepID=A0A078AHL3_STYLE|nr:UNKNOWN [Stylonychia lemnae]|eukprot:CDW80987.1 UNKNOWN [Stylonychia lemnae]
MMDYLEYNMRKIAFENIQFCSEKCNIFSNLKDKQNQTLAEERDEFSCFEKCIGKFTDSYEHAIDLAGGQLKKINKDNVYTHKEDSEQKFLMGDGVIYDLTKNGKLISNLIENSGKYVNELGNYLDCIQQPENTYYLQLIQPQGPNAQDQPNYVVGNCIAQECDTDFLSFYDSLVYPAPLIELIQQSKNYSKPDDLYQQMQDQFRPGFIVMMSLLTMTFLLCILGTVVQYTNFGNLTLSLNGQVALKLKENLGNIFPLLFNPKKYDDSILRYGEQAQRFIWVCFDTVYYISLNSYPTNYDEYPYLTTNYTSTLMMQGAIFGFSLVYFYSGFATMYSVLQSIYLKEHSFSILLFILRTYIFYAIPAAFCTAITVAIFPYIGTGPLYPTLLKSFLLDNCVQYWWTNILLISNFYPQNFSDQCVGHLTYISNEFQLLIVLIPMFVVIYKHAFRKVLIGSFIFVAIFGSLIPTIVMTYKYEINSYPGYLSQGYNYMFMKVYYRIPPFLFGILIGIIKFEYKYVGTLNDGSKPFHKSLIDRFKKKRENKIIAYICGISLCLFILLIMITNTQCANQDLAPKDKYATINLCWGTTTSAIYNGLAQYIYFLGLSCILLPSMANCSNILRPLLDSHFWHVLEELTFSAYILHFLVITWYFASRQQDILLSVGLIFTTTLSSFIFSYIMSIPFYLLVERPFKNFLDLILFPKSTIFKKQKDIEDEETEDESEYSMKSVDREGALDKMLIESQASSNKDQSTIISQAKEKSILSVYTEKISLRNLKGNENVKFLCKYCKSEDLYSNCKCLCAVKVIRCECPENQSNSPPLQTKFDINRTLNTSITNSYQVQTFIGHSNQTSKKNSDKSNDDIQGSQLLADEINRISKDDSKKNNFKMTVENIDSVVESRSSLKRTSRYQRSGELSNKRVSFDVNNLK